MQTELDFNILTKEQLVGLVRARGLALAGFIQADNSVQEKIAANALSAEHFQRSFEKKEAVLLELGRNEEMILSGQSPGKTN